MKNFLIFNLLVSLIPLLSKGQQRSASATTETIRIQGYLFIEGHHENIREGSDIPRKFLFIPSEKFKEESFYSVYQQECRPIHNDLFIPTSFMESGRVVGLNTFLRRALNSPLQLELENSVNDSFEDYLRQQSVFFKVKGSNKELNVTFIDGVWSKVIVPFKYSNSTYIERYNMSRLKELDNKTESYEYYYLLETKSFSPVFFVNDDSLFKVNQ
ncbi:hypothetical protein FAZ15_21965 [Sphingobacterium olei]|uniref:Uncharacterized protein n=1 Tax=Sphingobacterium olei TaxID=2571155 RepID=A0A4U0N8X0_9SPHI|nr:hypothetical protein [Sphingobacterium olei]TJZ49892.1 hypothetical protein FAZ15_21965 [Sphingobacterium olei]